MCREVIASDETYKDPASDSGPLLGSEEEQRPLSEDGPAGLVRLVGRRRLPHCAGSLGASNVACRGRTLDFTTAIQAVAKWEWRLGGSGLSLE